METLTTLELVTLGTSMAMMLHNPKLSACTRAVCEKLDQDIKTILVERDPTEILAAMEDSVRGYNAMPDEAMKKVREQFKFLQIIHNLTRNL